MSGTFRIVQYTPSLVALLWLLTVTSASDDCQISRHRYFQCRRNTVLFTRLATTILHFTCCLRLRTTFYIIISHYFTLVLNVIIRHHCHPCSLSFNVIIVRHYTSSLYVIIVCRHYTSSLYVVIIRHHCTSLYVIILRCHCTSSFYVIILPCQCTSSFVRHHLYVIIVRRLVTGERFSS